MHTTVSLGSYRGYHFGFLCNRQTFVENLSSEEKNRLSFEGETFYLI